MTDLVRHDANTDIAAQMDYAKAVSTGDLLPQAYRGKPANVLIAVGLGAAMGLSFAESLYRIDVIQGTPTASAELIASNVRKAGHKLRVRVDEQAQSATATIIRADDPDYEHTVVRDMAWAQRMGLASKDNYKKQPTTMLQWRAISAVARMACPEALYGVAYTPDEIYEQGRPEQGRPEHAAPPKVTAADFTKPAEDIHDAEVVEDDPAPKPPTQAQTRKMFAALRDVGCADRDSGLAYVSDVLGRPVASSKTLTAEEVSRVIDAVEDELTAQQAEAAAAEHLGAEPLEVDVEWPEVTVPGGAA